MLYKIYCVNYINILYKFMGGDCSNKYCNDKTHFCCQVEKGLGMRDNQHSPFHWRH